MKHPNRNACDDNLEKTDWGVRTNPKCRWHRSLGWDLGQIKETSIPFPLLPDPQNCDQLFPAVSGRSKSCPLAFLAMMDFYTQPPVSQNKHFLSIVAFCWVFCHRNKTSSQSSGCGMVTDIVVIPVPRALTQTTEELTMLLSSVLGSNLKVSLHTVLQRVTFHQSDMTQK